MAEKDGKPRDRKNEPWVIDQARREVEVAQAAVDNATNQVTKDRAQEDLKQAQQRLRKLLQTSRRDTRVDRRLKAAQGELDDAQKTADPKDDAAAQARVDRLTDRAAATESRKDKAQSKADAYFLSQMGPMVSDAIKEFPELREFFRQAIAGGWNAEKQQRELNNPERSWFKFWQSKGSYWRTGFQLQFGPNATEGTWDEKIRQAKEKIQVAASAQNVILSNAQLETLARRYWYSNWQDDPDALTSWMQRRAANPNQATETTEAGTPLAPASTDSKVSDLRNLAESYGLSIDDSVLRDWAGKILDPKVNVDGIQDGKFLQWIVGESRSRYGTYADEIDENTNLRQLTGGYTSAIARLLELNPADLKLSEDKMDPLLKMALTNVNRETGKPERVPLWQFEKMIRQDDRWQLTDNARATYLNAGTNFLRAFGYVG